jgi:hypothetical protein
MSFFELEADPTTSEKAPIAILVFCSVVVVTKSIGRLLSAPLPAWGRVRYDYGKWLVLRRSGASKTALPRKCFEVFQLISDGSDAVL